jgi:phenylpropionate dioxygenase-like ring-hydroxylating dioxygenase large terminal subunit
MRSAIGTRVETGKVVDGPGVLWINDVAFHIYVYNRDEDGTPPLRPSEVPVPDPTRDQRMEFSFPNLWQNRITEDLRIVAAFVPVDDEHTLLYLRFYQRFLRIPILRNIVNWLAMLYNLRVAHQDRRLVVTHQPQRSGLRMGERMVQGDRPIVEYRRRREELIEAARKENT